MKQEKKLEYTDDTERWRVWSSKRAGVILKSKSWEVKGIFKGSTLADEKEEGEKV